MKLRYGVQKVPMIDKLLQIIILAFFVVAFTERRTRWPSSAFIRMFRLLNKQVRVSGREETDRCG